VADHASVWVPDSLHKEDVDLAGFSYVILEELIDQLALLMASPWPKADAAGRPVWESAEDRRDAAIDQRLLQEQLYAASKLKRTPRVGDVFAVERLGPGWDTDDPVADARTLLAGQIYDVTVDAREAVKVAYFGVLTAGSRNEPEPRVEPVAEEPTRARRIKTSAPPRQLTIRSPTTGGEGGS
jgi:hypothetical protein